MFLFLKHNRGLIFVRWINFPSNYFKNKYFWSTLRESRKESHKDFFLFSFHFHSLFLLARNQDWEISYYNISIKESSGALLQRIWLNTLLLMMTKPCWDVMNQVSKGQFWPGLSSLVSLTATISISMTFKGGKKKIMSSPNTVVLIKEMASSTIKCIEKTKLFLYDHPFKHLTHFCFCLCLSLSSPSYTFTYIHTYTPKTCFFNSIHLFIACFKYCTCTLKKGKKRMLIVQWFLYILTYG